MEMSDSHVLSSLWPAVQVRSLHDAADQSLQCPLRMHNRRCIVIKSIHLISTSCTMLDVFRLEAAKVHEKPAIASGVEVYTIFGKA